jgi:uncharacterized protein YcfL
LKKLYSAIFLAMLLLVGCGSGSGNNSGIVQVDSDTVNQFVDGEKTGFFVAVSDKEESFFSTLEEVAKDKNTLVNYYYTYEPNGADGEVSEKQVFNVSNKFDKNRLYYVKDGEVIDFIRLTSFAGLELSYNGPINLDTK